MDAVATGIRDFVKEQHDLYVPGMDPEIVDVPEMQFIMIDGKGMPDMMSGSEGDINEFQQAFGALYGMIYSIKMSPKKDDAPAGYENFKVPPPEALWWVTSDASFADAKADQWRWTLMMRVPEFVTDEVVQHFADQLVAKKKLDIYRKVRLEKYDEGTSVQLMHIGSYDSETENIEKMHAFARAQGYDLQGRHHEIYYGDPRHTAAEKLRTVLRQPVVQ
jgi:hypothetical protein